MALSIRIPRHLFTPRGWGLLSAGAVALLAAAIMGRRDLLSLGVFLVVLPAVSLAGIRLVKPRFQVSRDFTPSPVETSAPTVVRLAVARAGAGGGSAVMEERVPWRFGESPSFRFPARSATGGTSRYEYQIRSAKRGQFLIGPVTAQVTDPFGLSLHRQAIDDGDTLTVTPAAVVLPETGLAGARGNDGITATRILANPSDDDVMTREYRHGDPMRRVHWPATARHGALMVRQEESVTTPEATIILDHRLVAFAGSPGPSAGNTPQHGHQMPGSEAFEWAVVAAMSICAHLSERNYTLRLLDVLGEPAFLHSPSAPEPESDEYSGAQGLRSVAESLAAIQLTGSHHAGRDGGRNLARAKPHPGSQDSGREPFDDLLLDKLSAHRMRGPLVALLGRITLAEARALAPAAGYGANAFAIIVSGNPEPGSTVADKPDSRRTSVADEVLEALRLGGWRAAAVAPSVPVAAAWSRFDKGGAGLAAAAADVRRGAGVAR